MSRRLANSAGSVMIPVRVLREEIMRALAADVGGTFTDPAPIDGETGAMYPDKTPSTPGRADAALSGIRRAARAAGVEAGDIDVFVRGFTVGADAFPTRVGGDGGGGLRMNDEPGRAAPRPERAP